MGGYKRLDLDDRRNIEEGLGKGLSFRRIASLIGHSPSAVAAEVKTNRDLLRTKVAKIPCRQAKTCKRTDVCSTCPHPHTVCARCADVLCLSVCAEHLALVGCKRTASAPWVCNGCAKKRYGCNRPGRYLYRAIVADEMAKVRRSASRRGVNMDATRFEEVLSVIRPALARNLSPYEIATLYSADIKVSSSTLYRWVERGYGGMANIDLERKVGFRPRKVHAPRKITHHGYERSFEAFLALDQDERDGCLEMDTVLGKRSDTKCLLTLYLRSCHFQLYILLKEKTSKEVAAAFDAIESADKTLFDSLFKVILTDNGPEFEDPAALERSVTAGSAPRCRVFYCDPRASQQKGRCEKNHSELRQMLPKMQTTMDALTQGDLALINANINSTPRRSLLGLSPLEMLVRVWGEQAMGFLDLFSIAIPKPDDIDLCPIDTSGIDEDDSSL